MSRFQKVLLFSQALSVCFLNPVFALDKQSALVHEVLTGDSVRLQGGKILKYAGIQAPPLQSVLPLVRQYGENSLAFNKALVEGESLLIEWGPQLRDPPNHLLGYVFLEDGTFVNDELLKSGNARMRITPPNTRYSGIFRQSELGARRSKKGLWKEEPENPYLKSEYLGEKNTKIYYFPTSPELDRIPQANLVTFRSRVEAKAAGYRACSTCKEDEKSYFG